MDVAVETLVSYVNQHDTDQIDKLMSIESTRWCQSNGFSAFQLKISFTGFRKMLEKKKKQLLVIAQNTFHAAQSLFFFNVEFHRLHTMICIANTFFVLYCQYFVHFFAIKLS